MEAGIADSCPDRRRNRRPPLMMARDNDDEVGAPEGVASGPELSQVLMALAPCAETPHRLSGVSLGQGRGPSPLLYQGQYLWPLVGLVPSARVGRRVRHPYEDTGRASQDMGRVDWTGDHRAAHP
jgi:hypothetical protein